MSESERQWLRDKQELELEKQLNKMTLNAIRSITEREPSPPRKYLPRQKSRPMLPPNTPEYTANLDLRDMEYEKLSNAISEKAMGSDLNWTPPKIQSNVTPEMIEDYQARQQQRKVGISMKYQPVDIPLEVPVFIPTRSEAELNALRLQKALKTRIFRKAEAEFIRIQDEKEAVRKQFDIDIGAIETSKVGKMPGKKPMLKILEDETARRTKYAADMLALDTREEAERLKLAQADADIATIEYRVREAAEIERLNIDEQNRVELINRAKLDESEKILNSLGAAVARNPGEDDDAYRARLIALSQETLTDADVAGDINLENFGIAKRNIKQFFSDISKVESIVKSLSEGERFELNKKFPAIKKKFLDTYGFDSKNMSEVDTVDFIRTAIANLPVLGVARGAPPPLPPPPSAYKTPASSPLKSPAFSSPLGGLEEEEPPLITFGAEASPVAAETVVGEPVGGHRQLLVNYADSQGIKVKSKDTTFDILVALYNEAKPIPKVLFDKVPQNTRDNFIREVQSAGGEFKASGLSKRNRMSGGIQTKDYPNLIRFGTIHISPSKLYYHNILAIKNGLRRNYVGITERKVSDALASIIMKIVDGGNVKKSDLHVLTPGDRQIYDKLMMMSGLHKIHDHTFDESSKDMKARLRLIEGEISAGNNNKDLLKEAHQLLHSLAQSHIISSYQAQTHYKHLKTFF